MPTTLRTFKEKLTPSLFELCVAQANQLRAREPILTRVLAPLAEASSLEGMLARHLSAVLHAPGVDIPALSDLFAEVLQAHPAITGAAVADLEAACDRDPACTSPFHALLNFKGFQAVQAHRIAHHLLQDGRADLASWLSNRVSVVLGVDIHPAARLGRGLLIDHGTGVVIGETTVIGDNVSIMQNVTLGGTGNEAGDRHPKIAEGGMIGSGAKVLGNVRLGAMSRVAACSVVLKDVPPNTTVAGVPAKVVRWHDAAQMPSHAMDQRV
ncbi:serine O-acetyltransferase [uncultured Sulfitobacter sp.]|uniref:serine O-acetyltransferase n=1 Tax=uncultured Sulfitobacter sp. TaxID=191468 RepID=UPI002599AF94|nr:serine O-acetyltransferase [uncultured Sulfitobacter sp.]